MEDTNIIKELEYWKERCLAAENVIRQSTLRQDFGQKNPSYQPEWYEARKIWQNLQKKESI